ncbi:hypothetical protein [Commensalibacter nepenthis]|uniref:Uncharacterized protein n=1 Tax=Commensalibacter nepenthis TaxID=3043872 RepID=A0ABT6QAB5_9PROT|nr:hypothetical protein [Commensalibacter sp. TBRC 10068]MDI2113848.1 hypothetical protein [Commensalibacter sp. TBRC 10068]
MPLTSILFPAPIVTSFPAPTSDPISSVRIEFPISFSFWILSQILNGAVISHKAS